jgi:hypothetical protein
MKVGDLVRLIPPVSRLNARKVLGIVIEIGSDDCPIVQWSIGRLPSWEIPELIEIISEAT